MACTVRPSRRTDVGSAAVSCPVECAQHVRGEAPRRAREAGALPREISAAEPVLWILRQS